MFDTEHVRAYLVKNGASLVGFADLTALPASCRQGLPYGIAAGIALDPGIVSLVPEQATMAYYREYQGVNARLDELCLKLQAYLVQRGYTAVAQTMDFVSRQRELTDGRAGLPHKTIAGLAGLGWIGKNALLVTEAYGCAIRFTTVLTDAPVAAEQHLSNCKCGSCRICCDACPGQAIHNVTWRPDIDRDALFSVETCKQTITQRGLAFGIENGSCGVCMAVCPYTKRYLEAVR